MEGIMSLEPGGQEMIVAVTYDNGQVFQHFGHSEQFKIYHVEEGQVQKSGIYSTNGQGHGALADFLQGHGVEVLICGGIGQGAQNALSQMGIELCPGVSGNADDAVAAWASGSLVYHPDTMCTHHEGGHSCGEHGHSCGGHSCGNH